jgi:hypothetical protein
MRVEHSVETLHAPEATPVQKRDLPARKEKCTTRLFVSKTFLVCVLSLSWETDRDFIGKRQGKKKKRRKMEDWARFRTSHPCSQYQGRSTSDDRTPRDRAASREGNPQRSGLQSRRDCPTHADNAYNEISIGSLQAKFSRKAQTQRVAHTQVVEQGPPQILAADSSGAFYSMTERGARGRNTVAL